ncbi:MAG: T9SS type A sorting domain-containing protein [Chitinophagaceae bacterium]|nr:T9SS type A sorting domain-containing protein [Chitinophagaceae bacterium]
MKKLFFLSLLCFSFLKNQAQAYIQGDITAFPNISAFHDSTQCASIAMESYMFTISNSFLGDSIIIKDQFSGQVLAYDVNSTGMNPWNTTLNPMSMIPYIPDNQLSGGMAYFGGSTIKFISGTDTVFNVSSNYVLPVPDACTYGNVTGKVYIDNNSDCNFNAGDVGLQSLNVLANVNLTNGSNTQYGYTAGSTGQYSIQIQESWLNNYIVSIPTAYQFIFPSTTCSPASYTYTTLPQSGADFALQCTSQIDVQSAALSPINVRPLIPFMLNPYVSNTGCDTAAGILTLVKDPNTVYNATLSSNPANYVNGDTLKWNFAQLTNLSSGSYWNSFFAGVHLTPNTSVNIGDTLCFTVSSTVLSNDVNAANNQYQVCLPVVNSYDPNIKEVMPKGTGATGQIPLSTDHLDYTIHFQNTGTAPAYNVSIVDTLDSDVDPKSLKILGASHSMVPTWLSTNVVRFDFYSIMLADSNTNEPKSHGQVSFSIKLKSGLALGTQIKNKASIYFDSNPAIVTNTTLNTLANPNGVEFIENSANLKIYPNPVEDQLMIDLSAFAQTTSAILSIYSMNGQLVKSVNLKEVSNRILISDLKAGLYVLKVKTGDEVAVKKFIKK